MEYIGCTFLCTPTIFFRLVEYDISRLGVPFLKKHAIRGQYQKTKNQSTHFYT